MNQLVKYNEAPLSLSNLGEGAAVERFDEVLKKVIMDINDLNTEPADIRKIKLEVQFKPDETREIIAIGFNVRAVFGKMKPIVTTGELHIGKGGYVISERIKHKQLELPNVVPIREAEK